MGEGDRVRRRPRFTAQAKWAGAALMLALLVPLALLALEGLEPSGAAEAHSLQMLVVFVMSPLLEHRGEP